MLYGIALMAVCGSFLHCATKKPAVTDPPITTNTVAVNPYPLKTTITGVVKNEQGDMLDNATVQLNYGQVVKTDASGKFAIETEIASPSSTANLYIQYSGMVPAVRSYHAYMQNAFYEVVMKPPYECCIKTDCFELPFAQLAYDPANTSLNDAQAGLLAPLADSLKAYPRCMLRFVAYGKGNKPGSRAEERLRQIQLSFTEKGITESRIIAIKVETKMSDVIEVAVMKD